LNNHDQHWAPLLYKLFRVRSWIILESRVK
jgi:hypothetical protein